MPSAAFLVVDFGTGGVKTVAFDSKGRIVNREISRVDFRFDGRAADFDASKVWTQICASIRTVNRALAKKGMKVAAVTSTSMREGNVFYDGDGKELLAVPNIDGRASKEAAVIGNKHGEMIYDASGHWPTSSFLVCRLRWLASNRAQTFSRVRKVSMVNDWVLFKLSGKLACEPTNGCETAAFDLARRDWSREIVQELGIDEDILPTVVEGGTTLGAMSESAARSTGLPRSTKVVVGAADTEAGLLGCGVTEEGGVAAVAGSTTPVQAVMNEPKTDPRRRTWTCCHVLPGRWVLESNAGATGLVFDWWSRLTNEDYATLTDEAAKLPPGSKGVRSLVGAMIFNSKMSQPIRGELMGVMPWSDRGAVSRAIIEGACYAVRANLEQVEEVSGRKFAEVAFCGGAAENDLWSQVQADVLNRRVMRYTAGNATARGAAMLAQVAEREYESVRGAAVAAARQLAEVMPGKSERSVYEKEYRAWLDTVTSA